MKNTIVLICAIMFLASCTVRDFDYYGFDKVPTHKIVCLDVGDDAGGDRLNLSPIVAQSLKRWGYTVSGLDEVGCYTVKARYYPQKSLLGGVTRVGYAVHLYRRETSKSIASLRQQEGMQIIPTGLGLATVGEKIAAFVDEVFEIGRLE